MAGDKHGDAASVFDTAAGGGSDQDVNVVSVAGTATSVNNGTSDAGTQRVTIASDSTGTIGLSATFVTPVTAGAATATKGFLLGGQYNSTPQTFTNGQQGAINLTSRGALTAALVDSSGAAVSTTDPVQTFISNTYNHISTATTTTVKSGAGVLASITVNTTAAGAITVYDNTAGSGTVIAVFPISAITSTYFYNVAFATGLTIVTAGASDLTVSYR